MRRVRTSMCRVLGVDVALCVRRGACRAQSLVYCNTRRAEDKQKDKQPGAHVVVLQHPYTSQRM